MSNIAINIRRTFKIQTIGGSYYIAIPKFLVTPQMLSKRISMEVLEYSDTHLTIKMVVVGDHRKHDKDSEASGKHA